MSEHVENDYMIFFKVNIFLFFDHVLLHNRKKYDQNVEWFLKSHIMWVQNCLNINNAPSILEVLLVLINISLDVNIHAIKYISSH